MKHGLKETPAYEISGVLRYQNSGSLIDTDRARPQDDHRTVGPHGDGEGGSAPTKEDFVPAGLGLPMGQLASRQSSISVILFVRESISATQSEQKKTHSKNEQPEKYH